MVSQQCFTCFSVPAIDVLKSHKSLSCQSAELQGCCTFFGVRFTLEPGHQGPVLEELDIPHG